MVDVLLRRSHVKTETQEEGHRITKAEIGVMWPQAKEYHKKLEKAREESPFSECVVLLSPNLISDF
jgi:hypothetical protein